MDAVDMLRLMFDVELRLLAVGRFSRRTGWQEGFQLYQIDCGLTFMSICQKKPGVLTTMNTRTKNQIMLTVLVDVPRRSRCSIVGHRKKFLGLHDSLKDPNTAP